MDQNRVPLPQQDMDLLRHIMESRLDAAGLALKAGRHPEDVDKAMLRLISREYATVWVAQPPYGPLYQITEAGRRAVAINAFDALESLRGLPEVPPS